ncbi:MAG: hypothetical protein ABJF23_09240 [Bryobacteraceae bacterium]
MKMLAGLLAAAVLTGSAAMAQYPRDYRGDDRGYNRGYERRDGGFNVIRAVQSDLERAASRGRMSGKERNRIDQALRKLNDFERDLSRGRFDRHDLDKAIQKVDEVVRSRDIDPRERNILVGDLNRLREFRFDERANGYRR